MARFGSLIRPNLISPRTKCNWSPDHQTRSCDYAHGVVVVVLFRAVGSSKQQLQQTIIDLTDLVVNQFCFLLRGVCIFWKTTACENGSSDWQCTQWPGPSLHSIIVKLDEHA